MIHARVPIKRGKMVPEGDYAIDGVPGTTAKIELSFSEVGDQKVTNLPEGKIVLKDRIADTVFQQILLRPEDYDVLAMPNLNGDYMSEALAAQVGGLACHSEQTEGIKLLFLKQLMGRLPNMRIRMRSILALRFFPEQ
jgi:hypothetical protein